MPQPIEENTLFYGDNLAILREYVPDASVDLIYLDPPFNSNRSYNILFKDESGSSADAQISAFEDTWHWNAATERTFHELIQNAPLKVGEMIDALKGFIGTNQMTAYLVMMAARLTELHRVLKPTGSLYLHCDPTASHYLKVVLDAIFGGGNFINEIVWKRSDAKGDAGQGAKHFGRVNDIILYYSKNEGSQIFIPQFLPLENEYIEKWYRYRDPDGRPYKLDNMLGPGGAAKGNPEYEVMGVKRYWRYSPEKMDELIKAGRVVQTNPGTVPMYKRYLDESQGVPLTTNWADIRPIHGWAHEKLGYPTQKPLSLLERIINASSISGDIILDPFCGCGTAIAAAEKLGRRWIGIDVTHLAISLIKYRMKDMFPGAQYRVIGEPQDLGSAKQLAHDDRYQFQWWALSLIQAKPLGGKEGSKEGKKGKDAGIDGIIRFIEEGNVYKNVLVQVKSGKVQRRDIGDLSGAMQREKAEMAVFITLEAATRDMITEAAATGLYTSSLWQKSYPRIQIITIEELLDGKEVKMPPAGQMFKQAERVKPASTQTEMEI